MSWEIATPLIVVLGVIEVGLFLYIKDRALFDRLALAAFLLAQKELGTVEGQELMTNAVLRLIDWLPASLKTALTWYANYRKTTLHDLVHQLAQSVYDNLIAPLKPPDQPDAAHA